MMGGGGAFKKQRPNFFLQIIQKNLPKKTPFFRLFPH